MMDVQERIRHLETENEMLLDALQLLQLKERECEVLTNAVTNIEVIVRNERTSPHRAIMGELATTRVMLQVLEERAE
ncbi:hypothetical protein [Exiguobacterium sp. s155]|uniref:hypothetical protein n=2 Tax=unclassified Exiguobacterium TaxID=2644629 RepID=UPI001BEBACC9|nr:hypothetical protein [Exiguobacterium sp. s155]